MSETPPPADKLAVHGIRARGRMTVVPVAMRSSNSCFTSFKSPFHPFLLEGGRAREHDARDEDTVRKTVVGGSRNHRLSLPAAAADARSSAIAFGRSIGLGEPATGR